MLQSVKFHFLPHCLYLDTIHVLPPVAHVVFLLWFLFGAAGTQERQVLKRHQLIRVIGTGSSP